MLTVSTFFPPCSQKLRGFKSFLNLFPSGPLCVLSPTVYSQQEGTGVSPPGRQKGSCRSSLHRVSLDWGGGSCARNYPKQPRTGRKSWEKAQLKVNSERIAEELLLPESISLLTSTSSDVDNKYLKQKPSLYFQDRLLLPQTLWHKDHCLLWRRFI